MRECQKTLTIRFSEKAASIRINSNDVRIYANRAYVLQFSSNQFFCVEDVSTIPMAPVSSSFDLVWERYEFLKLKNTI